MALSKIRGTVPKLWEQYWGVIPALLWVSALLSLGLIRLTPYGMDEGAARDLLLIWSVSDKIVNPVVTLGIPDFRALLFVPLGAYWAGSLVAAKIFTLLIAYAAVALLYRWSRRCSDTEVALIAGAMLLIAPQFINEADAIGPGVYLLLAFALGMWLNEKYRAVQHAFGGWFFIQMLWVCVTVSLHPAGLAYPLALAADWHKNPVDPRQKRHVLMGLTLVTILIIAIRAGWPTVAWGINPLLSLGQAHQAVIGLAEPDWVIGALIAALTLFVVWRDRHFLISDLLGGMLSVAGLLGLAAADTSWALIIVTLLIYRGVAQLVTFNQSLGGHGLLGQRGIVITFVLVISTAFMIADKAHAHAITLGALNPRDQMLQYLAQEVSDLDIEFKAASQWPGRTMIAARRDVFPLPKAAADGPTLLKNIKGITHIIFDHQDVRNSALAGNLAEVTAETETLYLDKGGAIIQIGKVLPLAKPKDNVPANPPDHVPAAAPPKTGP